MAKATRVGDILVKAKVIDELQLRSALAQYDSWGGRLGKIVSDMGLADEDTIATAISKATGFPRVQVGNVPRDVKALSKLDAAFCEKNGVFPIQLKDNGKTLLLAMADPTPLDLVDEVAMRTRARVIPMVAGETEILHAVMRYYRNQDPSAAADTRARMAVRRASEEVEFSVTQMGSALRQSQARRTEREMDPSELVTDPGMGSGSGAGAMLDQMLSSAPPVDELSPEEQTRLESVKANQEKSSKILRALMELLLEKNVLGRAELQTKIKT